MPKVEVHASTGTVELGGVPVVVPAEEVTISITGALGTVTLDGRTRSTLSIGLARVLTIDLSRSTGFHRLHLPPAHEYWFGTEDAKLRIAGIQRMLGAIAQAGLGWSGQLLFSDGTRFADPRVLYGWLDQYADRALGTAAAIAARPRHGTLAMSQVTSRAGGRILKRETIALVRARGQDIVEEHSSGVFAVADRRFSPRKVVTRRKRSTVDTPANRRVAWLISRLRSLAQAIAVHAPDAERVRCEAWFTEADRLLRNSILADLDVRSTHPKTSYSEEVSDRRYAGIAQIARVLSRSFKWNPEVSMQSSYAYTRYADEIYQIYVAVTIAHALKLRPVSTVFGAVQPVFRSEEWSLFCGTAPLNVLRSWLSYTEFPREFRPDIVLYHRDGTAVVGDAKYRNDGRTASSSSIKEVLAYMGAFDLPKAVVFYPPDPPPAEFRASSAKGRELLEVGVTPDDQSRSIDVVREAVKRAAFTPSWSDQG